MKFKSGDIIRGTEGDGKTWGNTTTLLLLHVRADDHVCAVILQSINPITGEVYSRDGHFGNWSLTCRDWVKIGSDPHVEPLDDIINRLLAAYELRGDDGK